MPTPHCYICGRWNDPTGGPDAHSSGCPNAGRLYSWRRCLENDTCQNEQAEGWDVCQTHVDALMERYREDRAARPAQYR